jgi:hypothetical protein
MTTRGPVPLVRYFSPLAHDENARDEDEVLSLLDERRRKSWPNIDEGYRTVILAEAGAGKTYEMDARARYAAANGRFAFFIRIEDIDQDFENSFEVGSANEFKRWLESEQPAWFYLDSIDEARLENPRAFEKAIRRFAGRIQDAKARTHICISSRPYAWRSVSDRALIMQYLLHTREKAEQKGEETQRVDEPELDAGPSVFVLRPLDRDDIRMFAAHRAVPDVDRLIEQLDRRDLKDLAGRPFDLEGILVGWSEDQELGSRRDLLRRSIDIRLGEFDADRERRQPLSAEKAREGAQRLAAAVVLTGEIGILVPGGDPHRQGIDAFQLLDGWGSIEEINTLLERAIFNDVLYGSVRFRHREVRELLAAEWFARQLKDGDSRSSVEDLIVRRQYGQEIIAPRLRPILPWLILEDAGIRSRVLAIKPEIAVEGGDPAVLPLSERRQILADIVHRIVTDDDDRGARDNSAIARIAQPDLEDDVLELIKRFGADDDAIFFLGRLVWQGEMSRCVAPLLKIAADPSRGKYARIASTRAVMTCGSEEQKISLWRALNGDA